MLKLALLAFLALTPIQDDTYLYKVTLIRAAPGHLLDVIEAYRGRVPVYDAAGEQRPVMIRHCPSAYNPDQLDQGGFDTTTPDGVGDLCQNADFNRDGIVDILDVTLERRALIGLEPTLDPAQPPSTP